MATEIRAWEIIEGQLKPLETSLANEGRTEALDLEEWLASDPSIIRPELKVIGRQVPTRSGPLDLLAVDRSGDLVVIELKGEQLPREALAQAIDYTSDVASWSIDKIGETCVKYTGQSLEDILTEAFPDIDLESLAINETQRIILVGFAIEPALERMIEWLSGACGVGINAISLKYLRTSTGSEVLTRTSLISEQVEASRVKPIFCSCAGVSRARERVPSQQPSADLESADRVVVGSSDRASSPARIFSLGAQRRNPLI